jgi:hypothetical protein
MSPDWASKPTEVPYANFGDPQSLNLYGYVGNNPLSKADKDGYCPTCLVEEVAESPAGQELGALANNALGAATAFVGAALAKTSGFMDAAVNAAVDAGGKGTMMGQYGDMSKQAPINATPATGEKQAQPLVGNNPKEAGSRTNTDLPGGHTAAGKTFGEQTAGQQTKTDPKTGHQVSEDGSRLRKNPDGTARVDLPNRGTKPNGETIHFNHPDPKPQPYPAE